MAPNSPACSFIHASMAGSRSTAPLNRSNSVLIAAPLSAFEICGCVAPLSSLQQNPLSGTVLLVKGLSLPANATVFYNPDRPSPACRQPGSWSERPLQGVSRQTTGRLANFCG